MTGVDEVNLVIAIAGLIATVAGTYFAFHEYRQRRTGAGPVPGSGDDGGGGRVSEPLEPPEPPEGQGPYDVFVSYTAGDADAATLLAGQLCAAELDVFLVRWVEPGLIPLLESERALSEARWGVLMFGSGTMSDLRVRDEYAALLHRKYQGDLRFVPGRTTDDPLPPLAAIHQPVDLTRPGTPHYDREVARLVRVIRRPPGTAGA
ncbi:toll/interleukin-1 receptor domain-containing protein [Streptomyces sp. NPDC005728]|uniref:toll/interleukin-1 receptor domain-containing protein n=1 Tax=Streptomyces sp. NPDC005728 TaxID=3157054 RepID=UPI0033D479A7